MSEDTGWGVQLDDEDVHPVVELILARMESHPDEFSGENGGYSGWRPILDNIRHYASNTEKKLLKAGERKIGLNVLHKKVMKKLLDGDTPKVKPETQTLSVSGNLLNQLAQSQQLQDLEAVWRQQQMQQTMAQQQILELEKHISIKGKTKP